MLILYLVKTSDTSKLKTHTATSATSCSSCFWTRISQLLWKLI